MKPFILLSVLLVSSCAASPLYGATSSQYQHLDPHSHTYSYGYADPNSQKHESRAHDGVTRGSYSYVDGHGHVQSISYTADPHHGFNAVGTNLPKAPAPAPAHYPVTHYAAAHTYTPIHYNHYVPLTAAGVPVDTPEVQHAKAEHAAAHAAAAHAAAIHPDPHHHLYKRSLYSPWAYASHVPLTHGGVPVDTPDVQAAKAEHYAAHAKALGQVAHAHGAPIDTPEVQHAKAAHFAAVAAASARSGHGHDDGHDDGHYDRRWDGPHYASGYQHSGPIHIPVIHNGVPVEPAEVQHARAAHLNALAAANHGPADYDDGHYDGHSQSHGYASGYQHKGPIHIPVIHNGVPVEPPEVQHARAAHLNALAAASHGSSGHSGYEDDGQYRSHYNQWQ